MQLRDSPVVTGVDDDVGELIRDTDGDRDVERLNVQKSYFTGSVSSRAGSRWCCTDTGNVAAIMVI